MRSFIEYVNRHRIDATVIYYAFDPNGNAIITAVLDDGSHQGCSHRTDRASLEIKLDPRFLRWRAIMAQGISQQDFVDFIDADEKRL